jgi:pellino
VLQDGTLIDLCGATLLWRSAEGLQNSPVRDKNFYFDLEI